jgi:Putative beta-barrel porin 2
MTAALSRRVIVLLLASAGLTLGAGRAGAQDVPAEPLPPGTLVLGPVTLTPAFSLRDVGVDDNVFNDSSDPRSDFTFTVAPRADVAFRARRLRLTYQTTADYVYFQRYRTERGTNVTSEVRAEVDLGWLRPYVSVAGASTRSRPNAEIDLRARHHDQTYSAGLSMRLASRTKLLLGARQSTLQYDTDSLFRGVSLHESFDGRSERIDGGIAIDLTPITTFSVVAEHDRQRFDVSPLRNSTSWRVAPTISFSPLGLLTGSAQVGYRHFDPVDTRLPDYSGLVASATIGATIYGRHQLQADYQRDVQ